MLTRREALALAAAGPLRLPGGVPEGVAAIIANTLKQPPGSLNTDWFGTLLVKGLLEWGRRHLPEAGSFGKAWLDFHLAGQQVSPYSGAKSRQVRAGGVPITTYAGHFGLAFPCWELFEQFRDERARAVCLEVADIILHRTARNRFGLVAHDDFAEFAIPDTCYFAVTALMIASRLDRTLAPVYREQAMYQLRTYTGVFLVKDTGLVRTILLKDGLGKTYWTRASGWLMWAMTGLLRQLPREHPRFAEFARDLRALADGMARVQDSSGGLRLFLDDPGSPLETTGTAMFASGVHEAIRSGWLPASFRPAAERAWEFVKQRVTPEGEIRGAYTGWAVPAEKGVVEMDKRAMGWIPGFVLSTAYEMTLL